MLKKIALAMVHPELFTKKELKKLMNIKDLICEKMYKEYVSEMLGALNVAGVVPSEKFLPFNLCYHCRDPVGLHQGR